MDYDLSPDQALFLDSVERVLRAYRDRRLGDVFFHYAHDLAEELERVGFLAIGREAGGGALEAALLVEAVARIAPVVEVAATALVAPKLGLDGGGPFALSATAELAAPIRFLTVAKTLLFDAGDRAYALALGGGDVKEVETIYGYPIGRLGGAADISRARDLGAGSGPVYRQWRRLALALEACGAARAALDHTVAYVQSRRQFGRAIASFQTVQQRLAECAMVVDGARWLALSAAWSGSPADAAIAATAIQCEVGRLAWDFHCFNGAQSWTLAYPLHFWTFRLRLLQGEMGGGEAQAIAASAETWGG